MTTLGEYPAAWQSGEIQARIRELASYSCEICGLRFTPGSNRAESALDASGRPIVGNVHHLDHDPSNCTDDNLMFLCQACHIRLHGQAWKPGDEMPMAWGNEPPPWVQKRGLPCKPNPMVASLQDSARYATGKADRAQFLVGLIEGQDWITGALDPMAEMRSLLNAVLTEYELLLQARTATLQAPLVIQAAQWADDQGFVSEDDALSYAGLDHYEFDAAIRQGVIAPATCPFEGDFLPPYYDPGKLQLDAQTRQALLKTIFLTRYEAADCLAVPVAVFERRRREAGIRHAGNKTQPDGRQERVYRKIDVEKLRR